MIDQATRPSLALWIEDLDILPEHPLAFYRPYLTAAEWHTAGQFKFRAVQRRFCVSRMGLRQRLAHYLAVSDPADVQWALTPSGKPYLPGNPCYFNVSHAGRYILYAVSDKGHPYLGVDVEQVGTRDYLGIAKRFFTSSEYQQLMGLPVNLQADAFCRVWTQKEAFIKAIGAGLSYGLDRFEVAVTGPLRIVSLADTLYQDLLWHVHDLSLSQGYHAALVVSGDAVPLQVNQWVTGCNS